MARNEANSPWLAWSSALLFSAFIPAFAGAADVTVTLQPTTTYQTILGWGATAPASYDWQCPEPLRQQIIMVAVDELGLTRLRLEPPSGNRSGLRRWEWTNDNGDPDDINWAALETAPLDAHVTEWILPFKQRVEANGDPFDLYVSPSFFNTGSSGEPPAWLRYSPGEYAEYALSLILRLRDVHAITPDYYCICNEAGNNNPFTATLVAEMAKTLGRKLQQLGIPTKIEFPECVNANTSWNYIQAVRNDADFWPYVGVLTYHLYGGNSARPSIRDFARSRGLPTGQTEYMGLTMDHLYDDLTLGGVSYWEIYGLAGPWSRNIKIHLNNTSFSRGSQHWNFRQVMHYVRPGAVRIEASSTDPAVRSLAFVRNGQMTVALINGGGARSVEIRNLAAGTYGASQSLGGAPCQELGLRTVGGAGTLTVNVPANTVLTVYPHGGANMPPTVTDWQASPNHLTLPASTTNLSASATDPELDPISYAWSVTSQPAGASVSLSAPNAAQTQANGLTVAGEYVFTVAVSDPTHTVTREVRLRVFADNQPPIAVDVHNRIPLMITLPASTTQLRGGGLDLEGDPLTYRWSIVSQPPGANALLATPNNSRCDVSNMTVAGDYVFRLEVSDPTHTVSKELSVTVYPTNTAPVISSATASPASLTLPDSKTSLTATTSDPDGDVMSHWWSVKSCPAGARPRFSHQGARETTVSGLTVEGTYIFTLTVVDRTKRATRDVTVQVEPAVMRARRASAYR